MQSFNSSKNRSVEPRSVHYMQVSTMGGFTVFDIDYSKQRVGINTQLRGIEQQKCYFKQKSNEKILLKFKKQRLYKLFMRIFFYRGESIS